jgi:hypothetical protein
MAVEDRPHGGCELGDMGVNLHGCGWVPPWPWRTNLRGRGSGYYLATVVAGLYAAMVMIRSCLTIVVEALEVGPPWPWRPLRSISMEVWFSLSLAFLFFINFYLWDIIVFSCYICYLFDGKVNEGLAFMAGQTRVLHLSNWKPGS